MNAKFLTLMTSLLLMSCLGLARAEKMTPPKLNGAACGQCHGNVEKGIDSSVISPPPSLYIQAIISMFVPLPV